MSHSYDIDAKHVLVACKDGLDYSVHGPFDSVHDAQVFARAFREYHGIPGHDNVEATAEENEAWTEADWYFGIYYLEDPALSDVPLPDGSEPGVPGNDDDRHQVDVEQLPFSVGITASCHRLRRFATEDEAAAFISTLDDHDTGIYFLDGPEQPHTDTYGESVARMSSIIAALPDDTREVVADALRVRAMDAVQDLVHENDAASDLAADIYRTIDPGADSNNAFDPNNYGRES